MGTKSDVYVILGSQFGDESKGGISYHLVPDTDWSVRFNGGNNAGHEVEGKKLHYLPAGILRGTKVGLGNGMVIYPPAIFEEMAENGIPSELIEKVHISERAHVTLPSHIVMDGLLGIIQGSMSAKSTFRGIAPTYGDKAYRLGITFSDLLEQDTLENKMEHIMGYHRNIFESYKQHLPAIEASMKEKFKGKGEEMFQDAVSLGPTELTKKYCEIGKTLSDNIVDLSIILTNAYFEKNEKIVFEGAQGFLLDVDLGIYPYGTSSNMFSIESDAGFPLGNVPAKHKKVVGVVKLPMSRVGGGCKPTKIGGELEDRLREKGKEYGTTTGRPRDVCWPCEVMVRNAVRNCGINNLAIVKTDVFGGMKEPIKVNTYYSHENMLFNDSLPASMKIFESMVPHYREEEPWPDRTKEQWIDDAQEGLSALHESHREFLANFAKRVNAYNFLSGGNVTISLGPSDKAKFTVKLNYLAEDATL
ncbi:MAG: adenylosuccinate synthetase [Candidatus Nanoarchaeia archaeon]|nr:adenylosuccinate synthetase [Candidatus Nanoarchaeia archaeon]MDD5239587.1 adenylosuccinate synthetase [Candidatus Nanoarchaeia archaeon]